jgi:hypothetical protein
VKKQKKLRSGKPASSVRVWESTEVNPRKTEKSEEDEIVSMLYEIYFDSVTVQTAIRLGKRMTLQVQRGVKLKVTSGEQIKQVLRLAKTCVTRRIKD